MNNPQIQGMDPAKLELIKMAASRTSGKTGRELAPIMLALITNANKQGIRFSPDEMTLILEILKKGKVPFYCSAWSNLGSVRNALKSGFLPAWVEMTAKPAEIVDNMNR